MSSDVCFFFFQAEDGIRDKLVTGVQTCALPICGRRVDDNRGCGAQAVVPADERQAAEPSDKAAAVGHVGLIPPVPLRGLDSPGPAARVFPAEPRTATIFFRGARMKRLAGVLALGA